ncbi:MAG: lysophospholipid acyltransferase family protein [Deltaproteobacteria bacterium]|jgi:lysophospholipid acyltransferase (LPLAT)-like uncharacterized protein|nr:lysophospholipid acyltransferase family protein [Deltaproteobacteria bacterium]
MLKRLLNLRIFPYIGLFIIKIISSTYKIRIINPEIERDILKRGQIPIYASWHQRFFPGITFLASRKPISIMISQSRDGELISRIVNILGWYPVRGSSSKGGRHALKEINKLIHEGYKVAHIVDGPTGPLGVVKPGLLLIAQASGMPIVPSIASAEKKWVFNSWDQFMVPKPFSRVILRFVGGIYIPRELRGSDFEIKRSFIEDILKEAYIETDAMWSNQEEIRRLFNT